MALAKLAQTIPEATPWQSCAVCHALATIPPAEADGLRDLLRSTLRYSVISDMIRTDPDTPLDIPRNTLARHARGECSAKERLR